MLAGRQRRPLPTSQFPNLKQTFDLALRSAKAQGPAHEGTLDFFGTIVSPADGKIITIQRIEHDDFIDGPAVLVGIFLSIFNVHINRAPLAARVVGLTYTKGKYLNALKEASVRENERLEVRLQSTENPAHRFRLRQISGAIARRIVCWLKPGDELSVREQFGMIKFGSRTEMVLPDVPELELTIQVGDKTQAGSSILGRFQ